MAVYNTSITSMNEYRGGIFQQAISGLTSLNNDRYDGKKHQTYVYEAQTGISNGKLAASLHGEWKGRL